MLPAYTVYFARSTFRNEGKRVGVRREDRFAHMYVIGKTGTGKSTLLRTMIEQDLVAGEGVAVFDPHGDLVESLVRLVPVCRRHHLVYLDVPDTSVAWHFNPLADVPASRRAFAVAGMVEVFKKLWPDEWGPRLEHLLRNVIFTLLESPGASLGDVPRLLADRDYRRTLVDRVSNEQVRSFWRDEYEKYSFAFRAVVNAPLQNKVGAFLTDPLLRRILTGEKSSFDLRRVMDQGGILLVNLAKGRIGEGPASLLGSLLVSSLSLIGLGRADRAEERRRDFFVYLDEFQSFATLAFANMLSELRKYRVGLTLAHQYQSQFANEVRDAVIGNVGTLASFRVGAVDAALISRELGPPIEAMDLVSLPNFNAYVKLLVNGRVSRVFSAVVDPSLSKER